MINSTGLVGAAREALAPTATGARALGPEGGEQLRFLGGSTMRLKLDGGTKGDLAFYEYVSEPGVTGPPQHVHHAHDETFYIVEGTYEFTMGADRRLLPPGAFLFVPRGTPHTFRNAGDDLGCVVGTFSPARFANYFRELAAIIDATGGAPDRDEWVNLYGRYDTTFYEASRGRLLQKRSSRPRRLLSGVPLSADART